MVQEHANTEKGPWNAHPSGPQTKTRTLFSDASDVGEDCPKSLRHHGVLCVSRNASCTSDLSIRPRWTFNGWVSEVSFIESTKRWNWNLSGYSWEIVVRDCIMLEGGRSANDLDP